MLNYKKKSVSNQFPRFQRIHKINSLGLEGSEIVFLVSYSYKVSVGRTKTSHLASKILNMFLSVGSILSPFMAQNQ
jgi:hypothetical protein